MPEPSTALPEQAPPSTPQQQQQAPVQQTPAPQSVVITPETPPVAPPEAPAATPPPEVAQLQQQLQQQQQAFQQQQESYRSLQGEYTRSRQALASLTGAQLQQPASNDPLSSYAPKIAMLTQQGYTEKDARTVVGLVAEMVTPIQQQLQQSQQALQGGLQVDAVLNQTYQANPNLFANAAVYEQTRQALMTQAMAGGRLDAEQAELTAVVFAHQAAKRQPLQQPPGVVQFPPQQMQQQQRPNAQPFARGMFGVPPNFQQQPQPAPAAMPADAQNVDSDMRAYFKLPPKTA